MGRRSDDLRNLERARRSGPHILTTVISKTDGQRFIVDAGLKSLSAERGLPQIKNMPGARLRKLSAVQGTVDILDPGLAATVGDRVEIRVHYDDARVNLHEKMHGVRRGVVEQEYAIEG